MTDSLLAYIAGFLDGDGCIMAQIVKRDGYVYGFQIRLSIIFYQKSCKKDHLIWLKDQLKFGYIRDRNDGMSEYTIVGIEQVKNVLQQLFDFLRLKKKQAELVLKISAIPKKPSLETFLSYCQMVDNGAKLNFSKKRTRNTQSVMRYLREHKLYPRND